MRVEKFEDLICWQKGQEVALLIYRLFQDSRDFSFRNQIQRAATGISNNIAEGFERRSSRELKQFLFIAKGSCGEVRSMAYLAKALQYITDADFEKTQDLLLEISRLISGFIKKL